MVTRITTLLALCCALHITLPGQSFDSGFQPFITRPGDVSELAALPDGRFYAVGSFTLANRMERANIARFLPNGNLDASFAPALHFSIMAIAVQPDGKVLLGGSYTEEDAPEGVTLIRLNADGSRDDSFRAGFAPNGAFYDIEVENNGSILVGGAFGSFDGQPSQGVVRLSNTGSLLASIPLNAGETVFVSSLLVQSSGRFAVGGIVNDQGYLSYHEYSGAPVAGFDFSITLPGTTNTLVSIRHLEQDSQGRIIFSAGTFLIRYAVGALNPDGSYSGWNYVFGIPLAIAVDGADNIYVAGDYEGVSAVHAFTPAVGLNSYAGGIGADGLIRTAVSLPGGGFLAGGHFSAYDGQPHLGIVRLDEAGAPVNGFNSALERVGVVRSMLRSGPDKAYISGEFAMVGDTYSPNVARILVDNGAADPDFTNPGISYRNEARRLMLDAQGRVLVAGANMDNAEGPHEAPLMRLLPNGAFDPTFQPNPATYPVGRLTKVQPLPNGQQLAIGDFTVFDSGIAASKVALYDNDGSLVRSFSNRIQVSDATEILLLNDGKILIGGRNIRYDGSAPQPIIRLDANLNLDPSFEAPAELLCTGGCRFKFTEQEDGRILVGGVFRTSPGQNIPFGMVRLEPNGALDDSFHLAGIFDNSEPYIDGGARRMINLPDGRILTVGLFDTLGLLPTPGMALLEADGGVADNLEGLSFERQFLFDALLLDDGDFLIGGILSDPSRPLHTGLARVTHLDAPAAEITGHIRTPQGVPAEGVEVSVAGQPSGNLLTGADGTYTFPDPQPGSNYTVIPMLNTLHVNGVSTFDLLLINRHLLGSNRFDTPYQLIAADVNNSGSVTPLDMIGIQKLILGRVTAFPDNFSWRFVDAAYIFPNPSNPWQEPFPEVINLNDLPAGGVPDADFIAIKVGDVDGSAIPGVQARGDGRPYQLWAAGRELAPGQMVQVPIMAGELAAIRALQFTLRFDASALHLEGIDYGLAQEESLGLNFLDKGWITASCYRLPEHNDTDAPLFTLTFRAQRAGSLRQWLSIGSDFTPAEAYDAEGRVYPVELAFRPAPEMPGQSGIAPNPFSDEATLTFEMAHPGEATLLIYTADGRLVRQSGGWYGAGLQEMELNGARLPEGMLYYVLQTDAGAMSGKMVVRRR